MNKILNNNMNVSKLKEKFLIVWKDAVWSNIIAATILAIIGVTWAKITNHSWNEIYGFILNLLNFNFPLYVFLSVFALFFILKKCTQLFKRNIHPLFDVQVGNYTFKELVQIMQRERLQISTFGMKMSGYNPPDEDLLFLFKAYYSSLNKGFGFDDIIEGDGGYLYNILAPRFVGFGLVDTHKQPLNDLPDKSEVAYKMNDLGRHFHSLLEKWELQYQLKEEKKKKK